MDELVETEVRRALEAEALAYEPPDDLAERTLAVVGQESRRGSRLRDRPAVRRIAAAAAVTVALATFFGIGARTTGSVSSGLASGGPSATTPPGSVPGGVDPALSRMRPQSSADTAKATSESRPTSSPRGAALPEPNFPLKVVRTAEVEMRVLKGRFDERWRRADGVAARHGGFVTASSAEQLRGRLARGTLTLRVPAEKLDAVLDDFRALGTPTRLATSANDASGQLVDFDARIRAAQAQEAHVLELLKQAKSLPESLQVTPRLEEVRRQIETLQGQRARLQGQVDLATVTVTLFEPGAAPSASPEPRTGLARAWTHAVGAAETVLAGAVVVAGYVVPLLGLAFLGWVLARGVRRRLA